MQWWAPAWYKHLPKLRSGDGERISTSLPSGGAYYAHIGGDFQSNRREQGVLQVTLHQFFLAPHINSFWAICMYLNFHTALWKYKPRSSRETWQTMHQLMTQIFQYLHMGIKGVPLKKLTLQKLDLFTSYVHRFDYLPRSPIVKHVLQKINPTRPYYWMVNTIFHFLMVQALERIPTIIVVPLLLFE